MATANQLSVPMDLTTWETSYFGIMYYLSLCDWLLSLTLLSSRFIRDRGRGTISFPFSDWIVFQCLHMPHSVSASSIDGRLGCSYIPSVVNNAAMNLRVRRSLWDSAFNSLESGNTGPYGNYIFNFLRKCLAHTLCFETLSQCSFYLTVRYEISFYHLETSGCGSILV